MDNIDINIIKLLQKNSRITVSEIAATINLSVPAVSDRIKKINSSGIIKKYTAILDDKKIGKRLSAFMFLNLENPKYTDKFINFIQNQSEIVECYYITGDFDYALKIITESTETFESLLKKIKLISGVEKTKTIVNLSEVKNSHSISLKSLNG